MLRISECVAGNNGLVANSDLTIAGDVVRKRYLRVDRDQPEREWTALVLLHAHARGLAPRPIARESDPPVLVMTRVAGSPLDATLTPAQTAAVVDAYRSLFGVPVPSEMPLPYGHPAEFIAKSAGWLADVRGGNLPDLVRRALEAARCWYADALTGVDEIRDPVVVQGDSNLTNMLWDGERVRLIDFEYAGVGDLAFEVADLVEHVSSRLRGLLDPETVIAGFDLTTGQLARVDAYRVVLATFWLLMLLPGSPGYEMNPAGSAEMQAEYLLSKL